MRAQILNCQNCNKQFKKIPSEIKKSSNHFCSRHCAGQFNMRGKQHNPPKTRSCKLCQAEFVCSRFHTDRSKCPTCKEQLFNKPEQNQLLTLGQLRQRQSDKNIHPSWLYSQVRSFNRAWNKDLLSLPCQNCGYSKHVELCHIKAITSFDLSTTLGEINHTNNVVQLCRNCHWEFDNNLLKLKSPSNLSLEEDHLNIQLQ